MPAQVIRGFFGACLRPAASRSTGTNPAADTRFGSSNDASTRDGACNNRTRKMPSRTGPMKPSASSSSSQTASGRSARRPQASTY